VLVPLAVDEVRGFQLLPDGGTVLRESPWAKDPHTWEQFLAEYAQLQRDLAVRLPRLLALGTPDTRPETLAAQVASVLEDPATLLADEVRTQLRELLPRYRDACATLAAAGVPASLQHDDLHDANVLVGEDGYRFFDWGDAAVAHPFSTLLIALRVAADRFELPADDPALLRLRDAYLADWPGHSLAELRELAKLATWVGKGARSLSWRRALTEADAAQQAKYGDAVAGWLEELLEPGPL
jgi:aminoglycoside phosphotransferase (APT) family kinase protein